MNTNWITVRQNIKFLVSLFKTSLAKALSVPLLLAGIAILNSPLWLDFINLFLNNQETLLGDRKLVAAPKEFIGWVFIGLGIFIYLVETGVRVIALRNKGTEKSLNTIKDYAKRTSDTVDNNIENILLKEPRLYDNKNAIELKITNFVFPWSFFFYTLFLTLAMLVLFIFFSSKNQTPTINSRHSNKAHKSAEPTSTEIVLNSSKQSGKESYNREKDINADHNNKFNTSKSINSIRPRVSVMRPTHGATEIARNTSIVLFINEALIDSSIADGLKVSQDGMLVAGEIKVTGQGRAIEFIPDSSFKHNALIEVFLGNPAQDSAGNALYQYKGTFRTTSLVDQSNVEQRVINDYSASGNGADKQEPEIRTISPSSGSTSVPINAIIKINFSEPINPITVNKSTVSLLDDDNKLNSGTYRFSNDYKKILVTPNSPLSEKSLHRIRVSGVEDLSGNTVTEKITHFKTSNTVDTSRPIVVHISPYNAARRVPVNAMIEVEFNESMDPLSLNTQSVRVFDTMTNTEVNGVRSLINSKMIFLPTEPLAVGRQYRVHIDTSLRDLANNQLAQPKIYYFVTGFEKDTVTPDVVSITK